MPALLRRFHNISGKDKFRGVVFILLSAFAFYLATFYVKLGGMQEKSSPFLYIFSRFALGYPLFAWFYLRKRKKPQNRAWLYMRAFWNVVAVMMFLTAANIGSAGTANFLNMTYPAFVVILAPMVLGEKNSLIDWFAVSIAIGGSALVLFNGKPYTPSVSDLLGWGSGITAAISVMALREIRKTDSTWTVLYYTFRLGTFISLPFAFYEVFALNIHPTGFMGWFYVVVSGLWGVVGQLFFTYGFRFVDAVEGSILSSTRILIALLFSYLYFQEELHYTVAMGAVGIFSANILLAFNKKNNMKRLIKLK